MMIQPNLIALWSVATTAFAAWQQAAPGSRDRDIPAWLPLQPVWRKLFRPEFVGVKVTPRWPDHPGSDQSVK
ncbi:hypothetical protein [Bradyrhizobium sp. USDA 4506]